MRCFDLKSENETFWTATRAPPASFYFNSAMVGFSFLKISICSGVNLSG